MDAQLEEWTPVMDKNEMQNRVCSLNAKLLGVQGPPRSRRCERASLSHYCCMKLALALVLLSLLSFEQGHGCGSVGVIWR
jgi:hypothetical protein